MAIKITDKTHEAKLIAAEELQVGDVFKVETSGTLYVVVQGWSSNQYLADSDSVPALRLGDCMVIGVYRKGKVIPVDAELVVTAK